MVDTPKLGKRHAVAALPPAVIVLLWGVGAQQGLLPHWEGTAKSRNVAIHQSFDPKGVITVCSGLTNYDNPNLKEGDVYTRAMCDDAQKAATPKYNAMLASCLPKDFMVGDHQHAAMLSFTYNLGQGSPKRHNGFCYSTVGVEFRASAAAEAAGNHDDAQRHRVAACKAMGAFTRANGVVIEGLQNRRYDKFWGEVEWCQRDD